MSAKGIARASRFTWRTTALETMALYKEIASDAAVS